MSRRIVSEIDTTFRSGAKHADSTVQFDTTLVGAMTRNGETVGSACLARQISARAAGVAPTKTANRRR